MKDGSVLCDVAIDQGGCAETSRPTTHSEPTYVVDGVIHYCVANMPGAVPVTSTKALTNATLPYVEAIADKGLARSGGRRPRARARRERPVRKGHVRGRGGRTRARVRAARGRPAAVAGLALERRRSRRGLLLLPSSAGRALTTLHVIAAASEMIATMYRTTPSRLKTVDKAQYNSPMSRACVIVLDGVGAGRCRTPRGSGTRGRTRSATSPVPSAGSTSPTWRRSASETSRRSRAARRSRERRPSRAGCSSARAARTR